MCFDMLHKYPESRLISFVIIVSIKDIPMSGNRTTHWSDKPTRSQLNDPLKVSPSGHFPSVRGAPLLNLAAALKARDCVRVDSMLTVLVRCSSRNSSTSNRL